MGANFFAFAVFGDNSVGVFPEDFLPRADTFGEFWALLDALVLLDLLKLELLRNFGDVLGVLSNGVALSEKGGIGID